MSTRRMTTGVWAEWMEEANYSIHPGIESITLNTNLKVTYQSYNMIHMKNFNLSLETNPLALGRHWEDGSSEPDVRVYIFDNEEDYKKEWP